MSYYSVPPGPWLDALGPWQPHSNADRGRTTGSETESGGLFGKTKKKKNVSMIGATSQLASGRPAACPADCLSPMPLLPFAHLFPATAQAAAALSRHAGVPGSAWETLTDNDVMSAQNQKGQRVDLCRRVSVVVGRRERRRRERERDERRRNAKCDYVASSGLGHQPEAAQLSGWLLCFAHTHAAGAQEM